MVRHAGRASAVAAALAALAVAGCDESREQRTQGNLTPGAAVPVRLVDCSDWRGAGPGERSKTVAALRKFAGGAVGSPAGYGATMKDDSAYELFDSYCAQRLARGFKLYKLYTRAAAFGAR